MFQIVPRAFSLEATGKGGECKQQWLKKKNVYKKYILRNKKRPKNGKELNGKNNIIILIMIWKVMVIIKIIIIMMILIINQIKATHNAR